jgi:hypothetical protein
MNRNLRIERLYTLGEYRNIKICDELVGITNELALRKEVIDLLQFLLMVQTDSGFLKYKQLVEETAKKPSMEDMIAYLDDIREQTLSDINKLLKNGETNE